MRRRPLLGNAAYLWAKFIEHGAKVPMERSTGAQFGVKLASAVAHAHSNHILHRDLKPSNVLITAGDDPHIVDFGLAKCLRNTTTEDETGGKDDLTRTGQLMGTAPYMPPEEILGQPFTKRGDIYGIGATLYESVTGRPPFQAATDAETLLLIRDQDPVSPRRLNPSISRDLETIILKCLEKEPPQRYYSAELLAEDLQRLVRGDPIHARPLGPLAHLGRWSRRHPGWAAMWLAVAMLMAVTFSVMIISNQRVREANTELTKTNDSLKTTQDSLRRQTSVAESRADELERFVYANSLQDLADQQNSWNRGHFPNQQAFYDLRHCPRRLRDFTWRFLREQDRRCFATADITGMGISQIEYASDGSFVVTSGTDGRLRLWDPTTGRLQRTSPEGNQLSGSIAVKSDGTKISVAPEAINLLGFELKGVPTVVHTWNLDHDTVDSLPTSQVWVNSLKYSPDGKYLATGCRGAMAKGDIVIWDAATQEELARIPHTRPLKFVEFSRDSRYFTSVDDHNQLLVWRVGQLTGNQNDQSPVATIRSNGIVESVNFTNDYLLTGYRSGNVQAWNFISEESVDLHDSGLPSVDRIQVADDDTFSVSSKKSDYFSIAAIGTALKPAGNVFSIDSPHHARLLPAQ